MRSGQVIRFWASLALLTTLYYFLLIWLLGYTSALGWPKWWLTLFGTGGGAKVAWIITTHTFGVLCAALPIALCASLDRRALLLGTLVAGLTAALLIYPSLRPEIWALIQTNHPGYFVIDNAKIVVAVPVLVYLLRRMPSNKRLERP
jgi:hypothetical protein